MKFISTILFLVLFVSSQNTFATTNPSELLMKVYQVAVAESTSCLNPLVIFNSTDGVETNFLTSPILGGGNIPDGTYHCVIITMSDIIKYRPVANDGTRCIAGTQYFSDVCRSDNADATDQLVGSTTTTYNCTGINPPTAANIGDNKVSIYLHTDSPNTNSAFKRGTTQGITLINPFVVNGTSAGVFVVDGTNKVTDNGSYCEMNQPTFKFR